MEEIIQQGITGYIAVMTLIGFALMGMDKRRAIQKAWRIPERTLFLIAYLGGGIGSLIGMYLFRHKTKHISFVLLIPVAAAISLLALLKLWNYL